MRKQIALIPAYDPDEQLVELVRNMKQEGFDVVVVDDGSAADKKEIFQEAGKDAIVLTQEENEGKGAALRTGLSYIRIRYERDYVVVTMDADGQHTVEDAKKLAEEAQRCPNALILGERSRAGKNIPLRSRLGNAVTRDIFCTATGVDVYDTQTGLRAFTDETAGHFIVLPGDRYEYEMNVLLYCARHHIEMLGVPIRTIYENGNKSSHFHALRDSARIFRQIAKFAGSSFVSFLVDYISYVLLLALTGSVVLSNISARALSSVVNFSINRNLVFRSRENLFRPALQYFSLVAVILFGNTLLLHALVGAGVNRYLAKMVTELTFFTISWTVQKLVIFRKKKETAHVTELMDGNTPALPML